MTDHQFNERMTAAYERGIRFCPASPPTYKRNSGLPYGYFKPDLKERIKELFRIRG